MNKEFVCNVCNFENVGDVLSFSRESGFCKICKSTVRMRSAIHALSLGLFGESLSIAEFPKPKRFCGVGLSDWRGYSWRLRKALNYQNTFFHTYPLLNITRVPKHLYNTKHFVIAIDVFEHLPPPVEAGFAGVSALLSPGGILVFSAPYTQEQNTVEHFPGLDQFRIVEAFGQKCLINRKQGGELEFYNNLHFHGGPGMTLEMRRFSLAEIIKQMTAVGFDDVTVIDNVLEWGIHYDNACSHTILARKRRE